MLRIVRVQYAVGNHPEFLISHHLGVSSPLTSEKHRRQPLLGWTKQQLTVVGVPDQIRTGVTYVKGKCPNR